MKLRNCSMCKGRIEIKKQILHTHQSIGINEFYIITYYDTTARMRSYVKAYNTFYCSDCIPKMRKEFSKNATKLPSVTK